MASSGTAPCSATTYTRPLLPAGSGNLVLVTSRRTIALDGAGAHTVDAFGVDDAVAQLDHAWRLSRRLTGPDGKSELVIDLGIAHRMAGHDGTAHDLLNLGLAMARETGERHQQARATQQL